MTSEFKECPICGALPYLLQAPLPGRRVEVLLECRTCGWKKALGVDQEP